MDTAPSAASSATPSPSSPLLGDEAQQFYQGGTAIITGASSGLGVEFARQIFRHVSVLVLAARRFEAMQQLAEELNAIHPGVRIIPCACDLATDAGRLALWEKVDGLGLQPTLLINNAGLGDYGAFTDADEPRIRQQIDVNITGLTLLTRDFVHRAKASADKPAGVLNVSSLASTVPVPDLAVYAATKSYVSSLSEALAIEFASRHIRVFYVCPGPTPTNFGKNARRSDEKDIDRSGQDLLVVTPQRVVSDALHGLAANRIRVFPGKRVRLAALVFQLLPSVIVRFILTGRYRRSQGQH
ncbi:MAG: SDR family NAD(P)-dependent oxidoreductase [Verrucomicrobium sp.]|nr:SDR family NAD(P)-dependent oxidoreductase [Verrucomicrobium sp.]